ncbi:protein DpdD [Devosia aquimaris]|uniref:protein DpdD n=1 Tax=Devosia aquimaris TaxID=2866214 RepID=UPI001CD153B0|nr:protein DpdD [Devosia sp. CJK-A8-3]
MIADLAPSEVAWLRAFFSAPNGLDWERIEDRSAPQALMDHVLPWLHLISSGSSQAAIVLPFVRSGHIVGWYATTRGPVGAFELKKELMGWLGPTYLEHFDVVPFDSRDPMAAILRQRYDGVVYRFSGAVGTKGARMADLLTTFACLASRRPLTNRMPMRPVGAIRSDFERALLVQDAERAETLLTELRGTGRLNEENLRYLDVRLKAGLGLWPQIARDHWLIKTLSDLPLPVQVLADLVEALYRTYLDDLEAAGDTSALLNAFKQHLSVPYPRLFATRRGIRTPRVIKAFLLFERVLDRPNEALLADLASLVSNDDPGHLLFASLAAPAPAQTPSSIPEELVPVSDEDEAEAAFDDGQYDRAFALYNDLPLSKRSVQRLLSCVLVVETNDVRQSLLAKIDRAGPAFLASLPIPVLKKLGDLRRVSGRTSNAETTSATIDGWFDWAEGLAAGLEVSALAESLDNALAWDVTPITRDDATASKFASLLGGLSGEAAEIARRAVPTIFHSVFHDDVQFAEAVRPIAILLFDLIALDDTLTPADLELLQILCGKLLTIGLSASDYGNLVSALEDVQGRIGSYAHLAWSLDICEVLAIAPAPNDAARRARQGFFLLLVGQAQVFAHRLERHDVLSFTLLTRDYELDLEVLGAITLPRSAGEDIETPDLSGKLIAIYTLAEAAARRAKVALIEMFPGVRVETNADTVATARLTSLAKASDIFVFAWKSSSHQAYYCVKDAMGEREPVMVAGKGTASLLRAVLDSLR